MLSSSTNRSATVPKVLFLTGLILLLFIIISQVHSSGSTGHHNDHNNIESSSASDGLFDTLRASIPGKSIQKRLKISEKLWQKSVDERHEMYSNYKDPQKSLFPATEGTSYIASPFTIWDFFPATYNCPHEIERVGRLGDGGKWTCGMSRYEASSKKTPCVVYSFGVQNESSFEEEVLKRTSCDVFGLDFSVDEFSPQVQQLPRDMRERAHFLRAGISGVSDLSANPPFYNIQDLMEVNGHDYVDILKMDIEGFEFDALQSLVREYAGQALPIGQLQVEIHLNEHIDGLPSFLKWWEGLEKGGLRPVWTEPNLLQITMKLADAMPRYAEYTFINAKNRHNKLLTD